MENKYYTPTIEEFHVGFECEQLQLRNANDPSAFEEWSSQIIDEYDLGIAIENKKDLTDYFRVKYLDREDIESIGWEFKEIEKGMLSDRPVFQFKTYLLNFCKNEYAIWLLITDEDCDYQHFSGKIKNKSELKRLMQQLNIQE